MMPLALVLNVEYEHQLYLHAGFVVAVYTIGDAAGSLVIARRMDRVGQTIVLLATGIASANCSSVAQRSNE